MATISTCDNCGAKDAFRVTGNVSTSGGDRVKGKVPPGFDCDLCLNCFERFAAVFRNAVPAKAFER